MQLSLFAGSHATHATPPVPQVIMLEGVHVLPWQQPVGHEVALQTHAPPMQACPVAQGGPLPHWHAPVAEQLSARVVSHATHAAPPVPQADKDGGLHVGPEQHPVVHVVAQPLHAPLLQVSPPGHAWQADPPLPHAVCKFPGWHRLPAQHPVGHEVPSHTQVPLRQCWLGPHSAAPPHWHTPAAEQPSARIGSHTVHALPGLLQAFTERGVHVVPLQHPVGQEVALHTHVPPEHCWPAPHGAPDPQRHSPAAEQLSAWVALHATHVAPFAPQLVSDRVLHVLPVQQPPGHEVASQTQSPARQRWPGEQALVPPHVH